MTAELLLHLTFVGGAAVAAAAFVAGALATFGATLGSLAHQLTRRRGVVARLGRLQPAPAYRAPTAEERWGLARVSWARWRVLAALTGFGMAWLLLGETDYFFFAPLGLAAYWLPNVVRNELAARARWGERLEIRNFLYDLQLALALSVTLSRALAAFAARAGDTPFARVLRARLAGTAAADPEKFLELLASDLDSADLRALVARVAAARRGGLAFGDALAVSARDLSLALATEAEYEVEAAPNELILPMLFALFPPVLFLLLLPVLNQLLTVLSGAAR